MLQTQQTYNVKAARRKMLAGTVKILGWPTKAADQVEQNTLKTQIAKPTLSNTPNSCYWTGEQLQIPELKAQRMNSLTD